jgi:hypothetical protein
MGGSRKGLTPGRIIGKPGEAGIPLVPGNRAGETNRKKDSRVQKWARLYFPPGCCTRMKQYPKKSELRLYFVFIICYFIDEATAYCSHLSYLKIFYSIFF